MKPTYINHPLREIHLAYNSDANVSEFEFEAITNYQILHNKVYRQKNDWLQLKTELATRMEDYSTLDSALIKIENEIKPYGELAGFAPSETEDLVVDEDYQMDYNETVAHVNNYQLLIDEKWDLIDVTRKRFRDLDKQFEDLDQEFDAFDNTYFSPIIQNWKEMEIDICSFDTDMDHFRVEMGKLFKQQQSCVEDLNTLNRSLNELAQRINKIQERMDLLYKNVQSFASFQEGKNGKFSDN